MSLDALLDSTDKTSKHIVMYDKLMHQITPPKKNYIKCYKVKVTPFMFDCVPNLNQF